MDRSVKTTHPSFTVAHVDVAQFPPFSPPRMVRLQNPFKLGKDLWDPSHRYETSWLIPPYVLAACRAAFVRSKAKPKLPFLPFWGVSVEALQPIPLHLLADPSISDPPPQYQREGRAREEEPANQATHP